MEELALIIALACGVRSDLTSDQKDKAMMCAEKVLNCIGKNIGKDKIVTKEILDKCLPKEMI